MAWNSQIVSPEEAGDALDSVSLLIDPLSLRVQVFARSEDDAPAQVVLTYSTSGGSNTAWESQIVDPENIASALGSASGTIVIDSFRKVLFGIKSGTTLRPKFLLIYSYV